MPSIKSTSVLENESIARSAIVDLLKHEHAVVWLEVEAKLAEHPYPGMKHGLNPHVLSIARTQLLAANIIESVAEPTRGGRIIEVSALTDRHLRKTAFEIAAARKRLLQARYLSWGVTSSKAPNMIGVAGERVARASLRATDAHIGYKPHSNNGEVTILFGQPVPGGPLDDVTYLMALDNDRPVALTIAIEVKNIRHWIYSSSDELFQLLDKCARLQTTYPNERIVPCLVCRRAHLTAFKMAKDIGFIILSTDVQPILPRAEVPPADLSEVVQELGYNLERTEGPLPKLVREFENSIPKIAVRTALRWSSNAPVLGRYFSTLRDNKITQRLRQSTMNTLRSAAKQLPNSEGGW
jgi:hypothetical protein